MRKRKRAGRKGWILMVKLGWIKKWEAGKEGRGEGKEGRTGRGKGAERSFVLQQSSLFCVEERMTKEHVPVGGYSP